MARGRVVDSAYCSMIRGCRHRTTRLLGAQIPVNIADVLEYLYAASGINTRDGHKHQCATSPALRPTSP